MIFRKKRSKVILNQDFIIDNTVINITDRTKFLGVIIDHHLSFDPHITYIRGKISRGIGILYKAKRLLNQSTLVTLYHAFVYPYFTYCLTIWGNTFQSFLSPLERCQKRAVRLLCGAGKYDHTKPLFEQMHILDLKRLYIYSVQMFLYKYYHNVLPSPFGTFFTYVADIHEHNTRQSKLFRIPLAKCPQKASAMKHSGAKIYNNCPTLVNYKCSFASFKYHVRKTLLGIPDANKLF